MMLNPYRFGPGGPPPIPAAELIGTAFSGYSVGTSTGATIPAGAQEDDLLLAFVMHRDTVTPPAGWTLVATQVCSASSTTQYTSVYKRISESGDAGASTTWAQATSQRFAVHLHAWRRSGGCDVVNYATAAQNNQKTSAMVWAGVTASMDASIGVAAASSILAAPSGTTTISASSGTLVTPAGASQNRLGVAWIGRSAGQAVSGQFTSSIDGSADNGVASISLIIA